jgi:hypothetical protein
MILIEDFNYALLFITIVALLIVITTTYVFAKCKELAQKWKRSRTMNPPGIPHAYQAAKCVLQLENEDWKFMFQLTKGGLLIGLGPRTKLTKKNYNYL